MKASAGDPSDLLAKWYFSGDKSSDLILLWYIHIGKLDNSSVLFSEILLCAGRGFLDEGTIIRFERYLKVYKPLSQQYLECSKDWGWDKQGDAYNNLPNMTRYIIRRRTSSLSMSDSVTWSWDYLGVILFFTNNGVIICLPSDFTRWQNPLISDWVPRSEFRRKELLYEQKPWGKGTSERQKLSSDTYVISECPLWVWASRSSLRPRTEPLPAPEHVPKYNSLMTTSFLTEGEQYSPNIRRTIPRMLRRAMST